MPSVSINNIYAIVSISNYNGNIRICNAGPEAVISNFERNDGSVIQPNTDITRDVNNVINNPISFFRMGEWGGVFHKTYHRAQWNNWHWNVDEKINKLQGVC